MNTLTKNKNKLAIDSSSAQITMRANSNLENTTTKLHLEDFPSDLYPKITSYCGKKRLDISSFMQ